jgi:hypothetical protein
MKIDETAAIAITAGLHDLLDFEDESAPSASVAEQRPVSPHLRDKADRDLGTLRGFATASTDEVRLCRNALLLSLEAALIQGFRTVHYSRDRNHYATRSDTLPVFWTYANVMRAVDSLSALPDVIGHNRVLPQNPRSRNFARQRSSIFAGPKFTFDADATTYISASTKPHDRVIIRDRHKVSNATIPLSLLRTTTEFLSLYDPLVEAATITLEHPAFRLLSDHVGTFPTKNGLARIDLTRRHLVRIFNGTANKGGRWYRAFWLEIPRAARKSLKIDGASIYEYDFSACHLRLAYYGAGAADALAGFGTDDLYALPDLDPIHWRRPIKIAVQILFNTKSIGQARGALATMLTDGNWDERLASADKIIASVKSAHPAVQPFWHSGAGRGLQFIDSEIIRLCLGRLTDLAIVGLPVHDAIIVAEQHRNQLIGIMENTFATDGKRLACSRFAYLRRRGFRDQNLTRGSGSGGVGSEGGVDRLPALDASSCAAASPVSALGSLNVNSSLALGASSSVSAGTALGSTEPSSPPSSPLALSELRTLVASRRCWSGGVIRAALLAFAEIDVATAVATFRHWSGTVAFSTGVILPTGKVDAELARFCSRVPRPISPTSMARLCGVSQAEAARLRLTIIVPKRRIVVKHSDAKRAGRLDQGIIPRIVNVDLAKPWLRTPLCRTAWYAQTPCPIERQVAALDALLALPDARAVASVVQEHHQVLTIRQQHCKASKLPVDELLARLGHRLAKSADGRLADIPALLSSKSIEQAGNALRNMASAPPFASCSISAKGEFYCAISISASSADL